MTMTTKTAEDDLAFMRALVDGPDTDNRSFGINYTAAGVLYGLQCFINGVLLITQTPVPAFVWIALGIVPTIIFLCVNFYTVWQNRGNAFGTGTAKRAINAAFAGAGIANLILALLFGWVAYQKQDWSIWFLFPVVVCALQGAIWFTSAVLRRRMWQGITAAGWFVSGIILAFLINHTSEYILALGIVLFVCMAVPGFIVLRSDTQSTPQV